METVYPDFKKIKKYKKMSELPEKIREKFYSLRLPSEKNTPFNEYVKLLNGIVIVEDCLYYEDNDHSKSFLEEIKKNEETFSGHSLKKFHFADIFVKDGIVIKNRFGCNEMA